VIFPPDSSADLQVFHPTHPAPSINKFWLNRKRLLQGLNQIAMDGCFPEGKSLFVPIYQASIAL
jgi:hypothetical protein